jgi:hypothetical protein
VGFRVYPHRVKDRQVAQWTIELASQHGFEIDRLLGIVLEPNAQRAWADYLKRAHAVNGMIHD